MSGSRDKGQVKLVAAKMKERAPAHALDDHHGDSDFNDDFDPPHHHHQHHRHCGEALIP